MNKKIQTSRRVRFNLPDIVSKPEGYSSSLNRIRPKKEHGTASYVNGTLITKNITNTTNDNNSERNYIQPRPLNVITVTRIINNPVTISIPKTIHITSNPSTVAISNLKYPTKQNAQQQKRHKDDFELKKTLLNETQARIPEVKTPLDTKKYVEKLKSKHIVVLNEPIQTENVRKLKIPKMCDTQTICDKFTRFHLFEDILLRKRRKMIQKQETPIKIQQEYSNISDTNHIHPPSTKTTYPAFLHENSNGIVTDLIHRWKRARQKDEKYDENETNLNEERYKNMSSSTTAKKLSALETFAFKRRSEKSFGSLKMNIEREPTLTALLRAARDADEEVLEIVLRKILIDGISKEALNASDKSGRTAISYICSAGLSNYLDALLRLPGIDVNKADNEGNTPLHFAAQAGQADAVNMMLTRCRSLQIDAKNCLGFTPLMKAALQGRTRCAKLLLFAGASPNETDSGRKLNAAEWARFCGREACAEMLEKCAKVRQLEKSNSVRATNSSSTYQKFFIMRSKTNPIHPPPLGESIRTKFKKFLPFGGSKNSQSSQKDKTISSSRNNKKEKICNTENKELVNKCLQTMTTSNTMSTQLKNGYYENGKTTFVAENTTTKRMNTALVRPLEVPILEVTPANNQHLIKKYEDKMKREKPINGITSSPKMIRN